MRVPRKIKKKYKKIWTKCLGFKLKIQKSSIEKGDGYCDEKNVWGCIIYPYNGDK